MEIQGFIQVNVIGTLTLFQASYPLLKASTSTPKFVYISSGGGSITMGPQFPAVLAYGASKAAANYLVRKLHFEHEDLSKHYLHFAKSLIAPKD
jgi:NAD(P)-dependent dehydrogenase (short-subunit alcohol dehydrogenase family)